MFILNRQIFVLKPKITCYIVVKQTKYKCGFLIGFVTNFHEFSYFTLRGFYPIRFLWSVDRGGSFGIAIRYRLYVPGIESLWGHEVFRTHPDRHWAPPNLQYTTYHAFPEGVTATGVWRTSSILSSAEVIERVEVKLYSPSGPSRPDLGQKFIYFYSFGGETDVSEKMLPPSSRLFYIFQIYVEELKSRM
jgi:hypothetical protein